MESPHDGIGTLRRARERFIESVWFTMTSRDECVRRCVILEWVELGDCRCDDFRKLHEFGIIGDDHLL